MLPECDWYDVETIDDIEDRDGFIENIIQPFEKHGTEKIVYVRNLNMGEYIKENDITKPVFEKAILEYGLVDNWTQAQGRWNQIWIEGL